MNARVFPSSEGNVWKYVFTDDKTVIESVLYKYEDFYKRTVICCSVMSGCPIGCTFCGTGKRFIRNLTADEIIAQILYILKDKKMPDLDKTCRNFQIMFMSMGEPMLNMPAVDKAVRRLNLMYPNAQLLLSTMGVDDPKAVGAICALGANISKVGLQLSIHKSTDEERNKLIPFENKMSLKRLSTFGFVFSAMTGKPVYLNYCIDGTNNTEQDFKNLIEIFPNRNVFAFTFSVICSADETLKDAGYRNFGALIDFRQYFIEAGYTTKLFDPAGQDDIGGGCGQLWYVQQWLKEKQNVQTKNT